MTLCAMVRRLVLVLLLASALPAAAAEQSPQPSTAMLTVIQPWSRATPPGAPAGVAYLEIVNQGPADTLLRIASPAAREVQMHTSYSEAGMMRMRPVASLEIPAQGRVQFKPGGLHLMLMGLQQPLKEGERIGLTLVFQNAGEVRVEAVVQGLGATSP